MHMYIYVSKIYQKSRFCQYGPTYLMLILLKEKTEERVIEVVLLKPQYARFVSPLYYHV